MIRSATLGVAAVLLAGCASSSVSVDSRPADLDSARDLARAVAAAGSCGDLEDLGQGAGYWSFTCQDGPQSFTVTAVSGEQPRLARMATALQSAPPVKAGSWFLVQEDLAYGESKSGPPRPTPVSDLDRFPGTVVRSAG